jgi:hypothetical protein
MFMGLNEAPLPVTLNSQLSTASVANPAQNIPAKSGATANPPPAKAVAETATPPLSAHSPDSAPALFGGHRGGGKKRADGLPAGSEAAKAADRAKNAERMRAKRAAALPAALPSAGSLASPAPPADSGAAVAGDSGALSVAAAGLAGHLVVPWSCRLLEKPAKLLTRILDRLRSGSLFNRIDASPLPAEIKAEIKRDIPWKDAARDDFAVCLADCATIELNKRRVNGADNAHWLNLALAGGELGLAHVDLCNRIDKLVEESQKAEGGDRKSEIGNQKAPL